MRMNVPALCLKNEAESADCFVHRGIGCALYRVFLTYNLRL